MNFRQPPKSPPEPAGANEPALQQAIFALGKGQLKEAELLAADFLKRNPTDPRVLQIFGSALLLQGEAERAIAPLAQAARRTHDPAIEMQAAMAMSKAGHSESALEWLERATKRRPAFPPGRWSGSSCHGPVGSPASRNMVSRQPLRPRSASRSRSPC